MNNNCRVKLNNHQLSDDCSLVMNSCF